MSFRTKREIFPFSLLTDLTTRSLTEVYAELNEVFEMTGCGQPSPEQRRRIASLYQDKEFRN